MLEKPPSQITNRKNRPHKECVDYPMCSARPRACYHPKYQYSARVGRQLRPIQSMQKEDKRDTLWSKPKGVIPSHPIQSKSKAPRNHDRTRRTDQTHTRTHTQRRVLNESKENEWVNKRAPIKNSNNAAQAKVGAVQTRGSNQIRIVCSKNKGVVGSSNKQHNGEEKNVNIKK